MLESLQALDAVDLRFSEDSLFLLNIILAFIMFGVALGIKMDHFRKLLYNPKSAFLGFFSQFFMLPALTFLVTILLRNYITPTVALGMILVASCPGGNISNFISSLARANTALSVSLTAIATLSAIFMTPFNFAFWGGLFTKVYQSSVSPELLQPLEIDPIQMFKTVFILLGIPLVIGMWVNHKFPKVTAKIIKPMQILSIVLFMGIVVVMFSKNADYFLAHIAWIFLLVLIHNFVALSSGFGLASIFRRSQADRRTISIETGIQNSGLGLILLFNPKIFPPELEIGGMAIITAWWGIWHILAGLGIAFVWSKRKLPATA